MPEAASSLTDCRGVPVSNADQPLIDLLDHCIEEFLAFENDPDAMITRALADNPDFVMGHAFKAAMLTQAMETRIYNEMVESLIAAETLWDKANDRERGHIKAVRAWVEGDFNGAVQIWEAVLVDYPFDILALALAHLSDVLLGDVVGQRDTVARVFPLWDESVPGYEFLLGFYSFGLEENRDFGWAEELGRRALSLRPKHPYAIHAVAHVMEMKGRQSGGIAFMRRREADWAHGNFRNHLWWHLSLFYLDLCQSDEVLAIYDDHLRSDTPEGDKYEELDASALLWRLKLAGVEPNGRWEALAEKWAHSVSDTLYAFNDVHAMMTFVCAGRDDLAQQLLSENERYVKHANDANVAMSRDIGLPFCRAIRDFAAGDYAACVEELLPVRYRTHRLGGSFAQRDIIGWTLLEAALRAGQGNLALALANERCELKPSSPQNWRLVARAHTARGDMDRARRAMAQAESLMVAGGSA